METRRRKDRPTMAKMNQRADARNIDSTAYPGM